jgi:hypothetical protein
MKARMKAMFNAPPTDLPDPPSPLDNSEKIKDLYLAIHETVNTDSIGVITAEKGCGGVYVLQIHFPHAIFARPSLWTAFLSMEPLKFEIG